MRNRSLLSASFVALFVAACGGSGTSQDGSSTDGAGGDAAGGATAAGGTHATGGTKATGGSTGTGGAKAGAGGAGAMGTGGAGAGPGGTSGAAAGASGSPGAGGASGNAGKSAGGGGTAAAAGTSAGAGGKAGGAAASGSAGAAATGGASAGAAGTPAGGKAGAAAQAGSTGTSGNAGTMGVAGTAGAAAAGGTGAAGATVGGGGAGAGGAAAGAAGSGGGVVTSCKMTADCAGNPANKVCDTKTGQCVACVATPMDTCPANQFCKLPAEQCAAGCKDDGDCGAPTAHCDVASHTCKQCLTDPQCPPGDICSVGGTCAPGCSAAQPCTAAGQTCCSATCCDTKGDPANCGGCGVVCSPFQNAQTLCTGGACAMGACAPGFADCNLDPSDGCEVDTSLFGQCLCVPGSVKACYSGAPGTENVGICKGGKQTCLASGVGYTVGCTGQVLPQAETCADGIDHNCDGIANNVPDIDGDGWTKCNGDCCETTAQCGTPFKVNPGAVDVPGDAFPDADCDGKIDPAGFGNGSNGFAIGAACDSGTGVKTAGVTTTDIATAMELCRYTTVNAPLPVKTWGILSAQLLEANGSVPTAAALSDMQNKQVAILKKYGTSGVPDSLPKKGITMVGMSSGLMRDETMPGFVKPNQGTDLKHAGTPPAVYLAANGGNLVASKGCSGGTCPAGSGANDSVLFRLQMRVPTNASSFSYKLNFYTSEYNTWQCTAFNDFYLALLTTGAAGIPADKNISFDAKGNPVSVNNGFFQICNAKGCNTCPGGNAALVGTGMELADFYDPANPTGGATGWLVTTAPVVPAETMTLDFTIFDVSDGILDSNVLLDNFDWSPDPIGAPTTGKSG